MKAMYWNSQCVRIHVYFQPPDSGKLAYLFPNEVLISVIHTDKSVYVVKNGLLANSKNTIVFIYEESQIWLRIRRRSIQSMREFLISNLRIELAGREYRYKIWFTPISIYLNAVQLISFLLQLDAKLMKWFNISSRSSEVKSLYYYYETKRLNSKEKAIIHKTSKIIPFAKEICVGRNKNYYIINKWYLKDRNSWKWRNIIIELNTYEGTNTYLEIIWTYEIYIVMKNHNQPKELK